MRPKSGFDRRRMIKSKVSTFSYCPKTKTKSHLIYNVTSTKADVNSINTSKSIECECKIQLDAFERWINGESFSDERYCVHAESSLNHLVKGITENKQN